MTSATTASSNRPGSLPTALFGRTGHESSRVIFGAAALAAMSQERADATLASLAPAGVNHIDTAASYGESELRLAPFLATERSNYFLATKTGARSGSEARASLERSLERMGVGSVDLIQLHNLVEEDEWQQVFRPEGALAALVQARDEGLCNHIGVTGHGTRIPAMHLRSLDEFPFDSVLVPYNYSMMGLAEYRADIEALVERCAATNTALQTIKALARRRWAERPDRAFSWYEPLDDADAITNAVHYVLEQPATTLFLNTTSDARLLPQVFAAAANSAGLPSDELMEADTLRQAITPLFDGSELERI